MLIPTLKRLFTTDFPAKYQELVEQLSYIVNTNEDVLFQALNNNLTLKDNLYSQVVTLTVTVDSTGKPISTTSFTSSLQTAILGTLVLNAVSVGSTVYPTSGIFCSFTQNGSSVIINNITGLPANTQFTLTLATFG